MSRGPKPIGVVQAVKIAEMLAQLPPDQTIEMPKVQMEELWWGREVRSPLGIMALFPGCKPRIKK